MEEDGSLVNVAVTLEEARQLLRFIQESDLEALERITNKTFKWVEALLEEPEGRKSVIGDFYQWLTMLNILCNARTLLRPTQAESMGFRHMLTLVKIVFS